VIGVGTEKIGGKEFPEIWAAGLACANWILYNYVHMRLSCWFSRPKNEDFRFETGTAWI
jgi:hypothetical protein